ncbi:hypothetical protein [Breznakia pachnodae]|uniref:Uncharacterized protein n=1 Tax=Breznakia pachnodae TaxID=265178 RepID=A0ABU0E1K5_9FIRM|nr:hypothetical protein [Breznakia pachnodae]MDQ0360768.1 hypothetical protein [Breznakia pachnodae]
MLRKENWIPIKDISDDMIIWSGSKVRLFNVFEESKKEDTYLEYLVCYIYGNNDYLQLTCLSQGEAGNIICVIKKDKPNHYSTGKELKRMMDIDNSYVLVK